MIREYLRVDRVLVRRLHPLTVPKDRRGRRIVVGRIRQVQIMERTRRARLMVRIRCRGALLTVCNAVRDIL